MKCLKNNAEQHRAKNNRKKRKTSVFQTKPLQFRVIARPQRGRGNLKAEGMASRDEAREHKARGNPYREKHGFTASFCFLFLYFKVLFHSVQPYFVPGFRFAPFKISASGARALLAMTNLIGFAEKRGSFWNEKVSITTEFYCAATLG